MCRVCTNPIIAPILYVLVQCPVPTPKHPLLTFSSCIMNAPSDLERKDILVAKTMGWPDMHSIWIRWLLKHMRVEMRWRMRWWYFDIITWIIWVGTQMQKEDTITEFTRMSFKEQKDAVQNYLKLQRCKLRWFCSFAQIQHLLTIMPWRQGESLYRLSCSVERTFR